MSLRTELMIPNLQALSGCETITPGKAGAGHQLSPRLAELLQLLADGKNLEDASILMGVSRNTVKNYAVLIRGRMDAETTTHAVALALREKIIT